MLGPESAIRLARFGQHYARPIYFRILLRDLSVQPRDLGVTIYYSPVHGLGEPRMVEDQGGNDEQVHSVIHIAAPANR